MCHLASALTTVQLAFLQSTQQLPPQAPGVGAEGFVTQARRTALEKTWHPAQSAVTRQVFRVEVSAKEKKESEVRVNARPVSLSLFSLFTGSYTQ